MPNPASKVSSAQEALRNLLNRRPLYEDPLDAVKNPDLPQVPRPPMFRPDTLTDNPEVARALFELERIAPELRGRVSRISIGPAGGKMTEKSIDSNYPPDLLQHSNMLGRWSPRDNSIFINPKQLLDIGVSKNHGTAKPGDLEETLAHELGHVVGYEHEGTGIGEIEKLARQLSPMGKVK